VLPVGVVLRQPAVLLDDEDVQALPNAAAPLGTR